MSWRGNHGASLPSVLFAVSCAAAAAGGCRQRASDTIPTQPFRDETEPGDGFQYYESVTPAGSGQEKAAGSGSSNETDVDIDVDDEPSEGGDGAADEPSSDEDDAEAGEDEGGDGDDDGSAGDGDRGDDGDDDGADAGAADRRLPVSPRARDPGE